MKLLFRTYFIVVFIVMFCTKIFAQNPAAPYVLPYYTNSCAGISNPTNDIVNVFKTTINNYPAGKNIRNVNSGCGNSIPFGSNFYNYTLYPPVAGKVLVVRRGDQFKIAVGAGKTFTQHFKVWVDWNQNNVYNNTNAGANAELIYQTTGNPLVVNGCNDTLLGTAVSQSGWITVPMNAACGQTRMRVRSVYSTPFNSPNFTPTSNEDYGEIEEYYVIVLNNPETPVPVPSFTDKSICVGKSITLKASVTGAGSLSFYNKLSATTPMVSNVAAGVTVGPDSLTFASLNNDTSIYVQNTEAGCKSTRVLVTISTQTLPQLSVLPHDTTICKHDTIVLQGKLDTANIVNVYKTFGEIVPTAYQKISDDAGSNGAHCGTRRERTIEANNVRPVTLTANSIAEVGVRIKHKRIKDIYIALVAPNGSSVVLSNANGSNTIVNAGANYGSGTNAGNFTYCKFTDTAAVAITSVTTSAITGFKRPQQLLSSLTGNSNGYWTLIVKDIAAPTVLGQDDDGLLLAWYIKFKRDNFVDTSTIWSPPTAIALYAPINTWSDINKRFVFPTSNTTYYFETSNTTGCSAKDSAFVKINANMNLNLGAAPAQICNGQQAVLTAAAVGGIDTTYWSPSFVPNPDSTLTVSPTISTLYTVVAKSNYGCLDTANYNLIVNPMPIAPIVTPNGATSFCAGSSVTLQSNQTSGNHWSTGQTTQSTNFTNSSTGVTCSFTDANGCTSPASIPVTILVNPLPATPIITAGSATTFCVGNSVSLSAPAGFNYNWTHDGVAGFANTQSISVTLGNTYSVTVINSNNCSSTSAITNVVVHPLPATPTLTASGPTSFCPGGNVTLQSSIGNSYTWLPSGANLPTNIISASGNYSVAVTDANGCTSFLSNPISVTLLPNPATPVITESGPIHFCVGGSVTLSAPAAFAYLWSPTLQTTQSITVNTTGSYSVQLTATNGCTSIYSSPSNVIAYSLPAAPIITPTTPTTICSGGTATLDADNYASYQWSNGSTVNPLNVGTAGSYSVVINDANGCTSPASLPINIVVNPLPATPILLASGLTTFCVFDSVKLIASTNQTNIVFDWAPINATTLSNYIYVNTTGNYSVSITDVNGCVSQTSNQIPVNVLPIPAAPAIIANGSTVFCEGDSVELSIDSGVNFLWSNGSNAPTLTVNQTNVYSAIVTDICAITHTPSIPITVLKKPMVDFDADTLIGCEPLTVHFSNSTLFGDTYSWNFGSNQTFTQPALVHEFAAPGSYTVTLTATAANGCSATKTIDDLIKVGKKPEIFYEYYPKPAFISTPFIHLEAIVNDADKMYWSCPEYEFSDSLFKTKINMPDTGMHKIYVTATNSFGCISKLDFDVFVDGEFIMYVPNAFTPANADELNDHFKPTYLYLDKRNFHMMVYDRWGVKIFDTTNPDIGWDGNVNNQHVTGAFNWIIECLDTRGVTHSKSGVVYVIR